MARLVVISGATGKQGGAVVNGFLSDSSFRVRALTRNPSSSSAAALRARGVEVVQGDIDNASSLISAFKGANVIYAMTGDIGVNGPALAARTDLDPSLITHEAYNVERASGKNVIDAVNANIATLDLFIFSTLSSAKEISNNEFKEIYHFDAKAESLAYLESTYPALVSKTVGLQLGMFLTNLTVPTPMKPTLMPDGRYRILMPNSPETAIPFIDPNHDPALFVKALASSPLLPLPKPNHVLQVAGFGKLTTWSEITTLIAKHLHISVYFEETTVQAWADCVTSVPGIGIEVAQMWKYVEKYGYFGGEAGGAVPITDLVKLDKAPRTAEEWVNSFDWSFVTAQ